MAAICPTDVVEAPVAVVWALLMDPAGWGGFYDLRVRRVDPPGPARVGQRLQAESGPRVLRLAVTFAFTDIDEAAHRLGFDVRLPLGISVREDMSCTPIDEARCRVRYSCDFSFPRGWRGAVIKTLLSREIIAGPANSLARLKAAAERAYAVAAP